MEIDQYFKLLSDDFSKAYGVAAAARARGLDPKETVEIKPAPDLASRVEGLTGIEGISEIIKRNLAGQSRSKLAFGVVKEICTSETFSKLDKYKRMETAVRVGSAILTEGILVAPTEGIQGIRAYRNSDGTDYISVVYAGPIRGAGGTAAALSVALADYARRFFGIGAYKATMEEVERYVEEVELYHTRAARLQYRPPDEDVRVIVSNCPICIDGVPTEKIEVGVHGNLRRLGLDGKDIAIPNRVRGGIALVVCEGIAQKAKKLLKEIKGFGLDWDWLNNIIKVEVKKVETESSKKSSIFLEDLAAGRPILAYPGHIGGFRLRYGRSRFTGIASKGFSPATMILTMGFVAVGGQLKVELPGKGCVAVPVDSIEGPFVRLKSGEALRVNDAETATKVKDQVEEILSLGDMLVTYGDFRKSNTPLQPTSYVEELWSAQLADKGAPSIPDHNKLSFRDAYIISVEHGLPIHPRFLFEFQAVRPEALGEIALAIVRNGNVKAKSVFDIDLLRLGGNAEVKRSLELINVPHKIDNGEIVIDGEYAMALLSSLGFASGVDGTLAVNELVLDKYSGTATDSIALVNSLSPFKVPKRSTFIGARIGRPEKARERLMKPAPNSLFPIGAYGGKDRNISSAYSKDSKKFRSGLMVDLARYRCQGCKLIVETQYCYDCGRRAIIEWKCLSCGSITNGSVCGRCGGQAIAHEEREVNLTKLVSNSTRMLGITKLPNLIKGVKGLSNGGKIAEPFEKGILRALYNVHMFKDGTARFDATDVPITHFYPSEIGTGVEKLRELGYTKDYLGNDLTNEDQLVELRHQDVILSRRGIENMLQIAKFIDDLLERFYKLPRFYNATYPQDMIGALVITLAPHISCGVLNRIIGVTSANIGFAHPYTISARRRNCDGDEDTTMLLMDALVNFSKDYLPETVGGTMDTPLILSVNIKPNEVDDEVYAMEVVDAYPLSFYNKTYEYVPPVEAEIEMVESRLNTNSAYQDLHFTHGSSKLAIAASPKRSQYVELKTMQEKVDAEFDIMDKIYAVNKRDAARRVITSHFIPDLIGNLHSFSKQTFRCSSCNAKFRRVPLSGKCTRDGGKLLLTISKGGIEKYLEMAIALAERYDLDPYIKQRLYLVREEIDSIFGKADGDINATEGQFSLVKYF
jgi:DNA polymerase II large subunit